MIKRLTSPAAQAAGFVLGALVICFATLTPVDQLPSAPGTDKLHHILGFGGWALLCAFGPNKRFILFSVFIILSGGTIELIQPYVNRYAEWMDFYANALGVILVVLSRLTMGWFLKSTSKV
ncbi:MAG: hypothetical protein ACTH58_04170 [Marinomonas foliarum]|jgi:hypothetical protein|uniref:VanZ like protein n=1 Tax=Marinomonas foliarum TaxID=491950 RepID=A0A369AHN1_9GAMM|nr:hypothetical protein [Marinomonas foliarum]QRV24489.1 hypothetical protein JSY38_02835 [Marinomonas foliarum]RCX07786.1 hypothetical protein DFP77_104149 [Marinomonas foliarum]